MLGSAIQIIRQASAELGLPVPQEAVSSRDQQGQQMLALLNAAGNELMRMFEWQFLRKTSTINMVEGQSEYDLASDFGKLMNQTLWEKSNIYSVIGPVSGRQWAYMTNSVTLAPQYCFIIKGNKIQFSPTPGDNGQGVGEINYDYFSTGWVYDQDSQKYQQLITGDTNIPQLDFWLLTKFLKLKTWEAKGLETTTLRDDFMRAFNDITSQDHAAPVLAVTTRSYALPSPVAPETGFGLN